MTDAPKLPTLTEIANWLDSDHPPLREEARQLFETVIPAALDLEVEALYQRSKKLLLEAGLLAGLTEKAVKDAVAEVTGEKEPPQSCTECPDAKPVYSYGDYLLRCMNEAPDERASRPELARIGREDAFNRPAEQNHEVLFAYASRVGVPEWCPRRR